MKKLLKMLASSAIVGAMAEDFAKQIEKMKCCGNCKQYRYTGTCMIDDEEIAGDCHCDKWELAE